jgi:hypothetical protein
MCYRFKENDVNTNILMPNNSPGSRVVGYRKPPIVAFYENNTQNK